VFKKFAISQMLEQHPKIAVILDLPSSLHIWATAYSLQI